MCRHERRYITESDIEGMRGYSMCLAGAPRCTQVSQRFIKTGATSIGASVFRGRQGLR